MHERRFHGDIARLRNPDRIARLEVARVVDLACAGVKEIHSVLDIGTGTGLFAEEFAARGVTLTGVDANPEMIAAARQFVPAGDFKLGIAEQLPISGATFDVVFMGLVLHEADEPLKALQEAFRVCAQRLAVLEWPYRAQDFGPGLEERIPPAQMETWSQTLGFKQLRWTELKEVTLYCFDK